MGKIFYTSDLHLGNANIIRYENRPWETVEEMDAGLIANWNEVVSSGDDVYVLGDFCFKGAHKAIQYLENLNGTIHLIRGNHDHFMGQASFTTFLHEEHNKEMLGQRFLPVETHGWYEHMQDGAHEVVLCHFPIMYWDGMDDRGSVHLYGHMHSRPGMQHPHPCAYNVGVDVNDYRPVTLEQLMERRKNEGSN